jgi:hypothetical protein
MSDVSSARPTALAPGNADSAVMLSRCARVSVSAALPASASPFPPHAAKAVQHNRIDQILSMPQPSRFAFCLKDSTI